jgi:dUTP pyrophosphatase|nr:MAG TPA: deoxyuridine 5'-triphosphate nucleotidohydrolase [Bacteriophage sp.]
MKESLIGLYVDNAEVPEYKSAGASGFDLRAKFNSKIPWFDKSVIGRILNHDKDVTAYLYDNCYDGLEWVIDFNVLDKSIRHAINQPVEGKTLLEYMTVNNIDKVNVILPYKTVKFETNIYTEIPEEDEMQIRPRSGISSTTLLDVKFGTVDNDWRGNSGIIVQNPTPFSYIIIPNSRLAQGVIVEKKRAVFDIKSSKDELSKTERGENGFGKSGLM